MIFINITIINSIETQTNLHIINLKNILVNLNLL